ncbi:FAD binding domain-containing protein [Apiospora kogelbergensis]|uniref:FAD binding domain-containing protein n=1 Tax=Apiospora kogelbergensis TaxID=1337665 RepID=UPI003131FED7
MANTRQPNPMGGQGANGAIESCAELINALVRIGAERGEQRLDSLSTEEVTRVFTETQNRRESRAKQLVRESHDIQSLLASESPFKTKLILHYISPILGQKVLLGRLGKKFLGASKLDSVPLPTGPRRCFSMMSCQLLLQKVHRRFWHGALLSARWVLESC